jgi:hypothetical protein
MNRTTPRVAPVVVAVIALALVAGCTPRVRVDPIEVKPIHIVHDINIRVDRHLDEFFAFQDQPAGATQAATQPVTATTATTGAATTQTAAGGVR